MCGILAAIGKPNAEVVRKMSKKMAHRGPDESSSYLSPSGSILSHERLSIIDLHSGIQPIQGTNTAHVIHNGEIYNHMALRTGILAGHSFRTKSDSEVIVHLYEEFGTEFCHLLDGVFAFAILDADKCMIARDPIGVKPLYYGSDAKGNQYFASEMKALTEVCIQVMAFPPGHFYTPQTGFVKYYIPEWSLPHPELQFANLPKLRESLTKAIEKRLMSDVPLGVLLSGGLDSSLVASVTKRLLAKQGIETLHSFSIGLDPNAPDVAAARKVAEFLGTTHHEIHFTVEQGIEALEKIVWHLETYDVTTIRASTPMYFLSKAIADMGIKVVLSGEGADEIFGGYLYFHNAPDAEEFRKETVGRVLRLSTADCLRADKSTMAHGLEARVPFLDKGFLEDTMYIYGQDKQPDRGKGKPEKYILRAAFDDKEQPFLPKEVLWRQKEQFGDGVGYNWIDGLVAYANQTISDDEMIDLQALYPYNTPETKEALLYRRMFEKHFSKAKADLTVLKWVPKWQKSTDPSGRVCDNHEQHVAGLKHDKVEEMKMEKRA